MPVGTTRVASIGALPAVMDELGVRIQPLLDAVRLPRTLFEDPDRPVDLGKAIRLLKFAAQRADCPHLGLLCGQRHRPETIGIAGRIARNARDVGTALRGLALYLHLNGHAFVPSLTVAGDTAEFALHRVSDGPGRRLVVDLGMAGAFAILRTVCGPQWRPLDVLLVHSPGGSRTPYDRYYGVPVRFGSDRDAIAFPAAWLGRRVHGADDATLPLLERELAVMTNRNRLPPATATRRILLACIARGDITVRAVAAASGLHPRTLNRRLAKEGTSVFALMADVRYQIARDLLENTTLPVTDIAATLVYADLGSFTRAFCRWAGVSPSAWRRKARRAPAGPAQAEQTCQTR